MAVLPILRTENVEGSTFPSAPEGRGYRRGWWVRVGAWVGWRCWLFWRSLSSLEEMPARAASRWGSPVGALRALIGSWDVARAPEAVAPAERDADRDPERDVGVVSVPRPPALRRGASPVLRLGVFPAVRPPARPLVLRPGASPAVRPVVLRWGAGCSAPAGARGAACGPAWGPGRVGAGAVPVPWLARRREGASGQALAPGAPEAPAPAAPRPDRPDRLG